MKMKKMFALPVVVALLVSSWCLPAEPLQPSSADSAQSTGDEASQYAEGTRAIRESRWPDAVGLFGHVAELHGEHAGGALYWKAYAESKEGQAANALSTC